jgi:uncharacterized protein YndB with AHSA1/START domain
MNAATHASFVIERDFLAAPSRVFRAWSDLAQKQRWTDCQPGLLERRHTQDFRPGGAEQVTMRFPEGGVCTVRFHYFDIVPDRRIVYGYSMENDGLTGSVSLVTVEFEPTPAGTRMRFTEQAALLEEGQDLAERIEGTREGFDRLAREVEPAPAP